ncbi:MAG: head decoration protein [Aeromonas veronii]|nr:hypothetical protein [Aeromonas phage phiWae15]
MNGHTPFAGNVDLGTYSPVHLFAGSADIVTDHFPVGANLAQYQVFAVNAAGAAVPHDPTASDGTEKAVGITLYAVTQSAGGNVAGYIGGDFNHEVLVWHSSLDTLAKRKAAFLRTNIAIKSLL